MSILYKHAVNNNSSHVYTYTYLSYIYTVHNVGFIKIYLNILNKPTYPV